MLLGIDDAGRGPVLGPMVLAGILIDENELNELKSFGVKDSKLLSPVTRKQIKERLVSRFEHFIVTSSPREIDESSNLNYLEAIKSAMIINKFLAKTSKKIKVVIDCPSVNLASWKSDVEGLIEKSGLVELKVEHKADEKYPIVSAASIIAKERREDEMENLRIELDADFGSGYPSDPKTKKFIKKHFNDEKYRRIIRFSWKTVKKLFEEAKQEKLF